jgi:hypothetical protein
LADPRWPHFAAAYDRYIGRAQNNEPGETNRDAGNVSLGESLSVFQSPVGKSGAFELGVQAAVFADFDMDLKTVDLINADYFVGLMAEYRQGDFSTLLRVFHQSSHLGDNFLLNNPGVTRFELSYEEPNVIFSEDLFHRSLRVYGGGGYLIDVVPSDLKPGVVESGVEYFGPPIVHNLSMIPVAAVDIQNREQNNWSTDISARVGVQFQNPREVHSACGPDAGILRRPFAQRTILSSEDPIPGDWAQPLFMKRRGADGSGRGAFGGFEKMPRGLMHPC